jgi:hypothetical protein
MNNPLDYRCPTCSAQPGNRCRARRTGRVTDTHMPRWDLADLADLRAQEPTR